MSTPVKDHAFVSSIPDVYDRLLVPLIFEAPASDLATRLARMQVTRVLEIAAGTGVLSRQLAAALPPATSIVATDLNQPMLTVAQASALARPVEWRVADALDLHFPDASFDAVVCQFGVMFFPDKQKAYSEARRVLRPGGHLVFNVWDHIEHNDFAHVTELALEALFPDAPPRFMSRTPHGYFDQPTIERDLNAAGFSALPQFSTVSFRCHADAPLVPATAFCQGTPLRYEIEAHGADRVSEATDYVAQKIAERFGSGAIEGESRARVIDVVR